MGKKIQLILLSFNVFVYFTCSLLTSDCSEQPKNYQPYISKEKQIENKKIRALYKKALQKMPYSLELHDAREAVRRVEDRDGGVIVFVPMEQVVSTGKA